MQRLASYFRSPPKPGDGAGGEPPLDLAADPAILRAAAAGNVGALVRLLCERERRYAHTGQLGIAICETDSAGNTALHHAVRVGQLDAARALVAKGGPITAINAAGMSPLDIAAIHNQPACVTLLLEAGAPMSPAHGMQFVSRPSALAGRQRLSAIEFAISAGHVDCVLAFLEGGAGRELGYDAVGRALVQPSPGETGRPILDQRHGAAARIQKWWRRHGAQRTSSRAAAATKIQVWYRSHCTRLWLSRTVKAHEPSTTLGADGVAAFFDSDAHLGVVGEVLASCPDAGTAVHRAEKTDLVDAKLARRSSDAHSDLPAVSGGGAGRAALPKGFVSKFPTYLQKATDDPLLVRSWPAQSAPIVGVITGGPTRILQTYHTNVTFAEHGPEPRPELSTESLSGLLGLGFSHRPPGPASADSCRRVWIRLANPQRIWGDQQAWVVASLLKPVRSFGRSADGSSGLFNGGVDLADPCCDVCVALESGVLASGGPSASYVLPAFYQHICQLPASSEGAECPGCGRITKHLSGARTAAGVDIGIGSRPSVCFVELALRAYRGGACEVLAMFGRSARCARYLVETPVPCQQSRLGRHSVLQLAALENDVTMIAELLEHSRNSCYDALLRAGLGNPLLMACASGATGAAVALIRATCAVRDECWDECRRLTPATSPSSPASPEVPAAERCRAAVKLLRSAACIALTTRSWPLIEVLTATGTGLDTVVDVEVADWQWALDPERMTAIFATARSSAPATPLDLFLLGVSNQPARTDDGAARPTAAAHTLQSTNPFSTFFARTTGGTQCNSCGPIDDDGGCSRSPAAVDLADLDRLLGLGCPIDVTGVDGVTTLMRLLGDGNVDTARALLQRGACDAIPDAEGHTAWWHAARVGSLVGLEAMFQFRMDGAKAALDRGDTIQAEDMLDWQSGLNSYSPGWPAASPSSLGASPLHAAVLCHGNGATDANDSDSSGHIVAVLEFLINRGCRVPMGTLRDFVGQLLSAGLTASATHLLRTEMERLAAAFDRLVQQRCRLESSPSSDSDLAYTAFKTHVDRLQHVLSALNVLQGAGADIDAIVAVCTGPSVTTAVQIEYVRHCCGRQSRFGLLSNVLPWGHAGLAAKLFAMLFGPGDVNARLHTHYTSNQAALAQNWLPTLLESVNEQVLTGQWRAVLSVVLVFPDKTKRLSALATLATKLDGQPASQDEAKERICKAIDIDPIIEKDQHSTNDLVRKAARDFVGQLFPEHAVKCGICLGPVIDTVACCQQTGGEHYKKVSCTHEYCKACLVPWIECNLEESCAQIGCPHTECAFNFNGEDVRRIAGDGAYVKFLDITTRNYQARLTDASRGMDKKTTEWLNLNTRVCPSCSVVIERSSGCNSMKCFTCGNRFNWSEAKTVKDSVKSATTPGAGTPGGGGGSATPLRSLFGGMPARLQTVFA